MDVSALIDLVRDLHRAAIRVEDATLTSGHAPLPEPDRDGDGVPDDVDDCPDLADPAQRDVFAPAAVAVLDEPMVWVAIDVDGDGADDLITRTIQADGEVWGWRSMGADGTFGATTPITTLPAGVRWVKAGDLDGNATADVVIASSSGVSWYRDATEPAIPLRDRNTPALALVDIDGDADLDVVYGDPTGLGWSENLGGTFGSENVVSGANGNPTSIQADDFDLDGDQDLLVGDFHRGQVWFDNLGGGSFAQGIPVLDGGGVGSLGDVDADGDDDLLVMRPGSTLALYENVAGQFTLGVSVGDDPLTGMFADWDGDGDADVITYDYDGNGLFQSDGAGAFVEWQSVDSEGRPWVGDFDGDGDPDVFAEGTELWSENVYVAITDGDGDGVCDPSDQCEGDDAESDVDADGWCSDLDCADDDPTRYPGAPELCDRLDDACTGELPADESDADGDGFAACDDCDDADPGRHPGASGACDGVDANCDGDLDPTEDCPADAPDPAVSAEPEPEPTGCGCGSTPASGASVLAGALAAVVLRRRPVRAPTSA
ncbi:MAG: FG-GAP-like repeat-containing protein [Myxococcota bacterium]